MLNNNNNNIIIIIVYRRYNVEIIYYAIYDKSEKFNK